VLCDLLGKQEEKSKLTELQLSSLREYTELFSQEG